MILQNHIRFINPAKGWRCKTGDSGPENLSSQNLSKGEQDRLLSAVQNERHRLKRLKIITAASWTAFVLYLLIYYSLYLLTPTFNLTVGAVPLIILQAVAIVFTVSLIIRSKTSPYHQLTQTLTNIQQQLETLNERQK